MRGLFTAGIMDVLMEADISFDGLVGVSAGACFGCNYKSKQPGRVLRYNLRYAHDPRYCSLLSLLLTGGIYGARFAYYRLPLELDLFDRDTYESNPMQFHLVATDVNTGQPVYRRIDSGGEELCRWTLASSSMPLVSRIVDIDGHHYLDGGITDSIPLRFFQQQGFERNLVVLTQPAGYHKGPLPHQRLLRLALRRYPQLFQAWQRRHEMYNEQLDYIARQQSLGNTLVLCPEVPLPINHISHSRSLMRQAYNLGRNLALRRLDDIRAFLA